VNSEETRNRPTIGLLDMASSLEKPNPPTGVALWELIHCQNAAGTDQA